jgi:lipopolysaccharide transport system ATP-binding protein
MAAVTALCDRVIWIDKGSVKDFNNTAHVVQAYNTFCMRGAMPAGTVKSEVPQEAKPLVDRSTSYEFFSNIQNAEGWTTGSATIEDVLIEPQDQSDGLEFIAGQLVRLRIVVRAHAQLLSPIIGFFVKDSFGQPLFGENTFEHTHCPADNGNKLTADFYFNLPYLGGGEYFISAAVADGDLDEHIQHHWVHDAVQLRVVKSKRHFGLVGIPFQKIEINKV